jgi:replicative DNA helicase
VSDKLAYRLRGKTAIFVLDRDFAGYSAAKKAPKTYEEFGARTLVQELPNEAGKDPGQWWEKNPDGLREWIAEIRQRWLSEGDIGFVTELFDPSTAQLPTLPTGITELDKLLKGGYAPGLHIVAGEPAAGKSALVQYLTRTWANAGHRVLEVSTELPPRQVWARIISPVVGIDWNELEATPGKFSYVRDNAKVGQLASMISVLGNVSIAEISLAATRYDIIVIDYLQAMSEVQEDPRLAINKLLRELTNLSLNQGKVIILVSEYGRHVYRRNADGSKPTPDKTSYKESGSIEYRAQSALNLVRGEGSKIMEGHLVKNTRGFEGRFFMKVSLESNMFEDYYVAGGE